MRQRRREATADDLSLSKVHRREGYLATAQIKPVIFTLLRCTSAELFFFGCDSFTAPRAAAWAPRPTTEKEEKKDKEEAKERGRAARGVLFRSSTKGACSVLGRTFQTIARKR
jgi:hypothetical protein